MLVLGVVDRVEWMRFDCGCGDGVWKDVGVCVICDCVCECVVGVGEGGGVDRVGVRVDSRVGELNRIRGC